MHLLELIEFQDKEENYNLLYNWLQQEYIYKWFEQRKLSYKEIKEKYKNKLSNNEQSLYLIMYNKVPIGYTQIYKYDDTYYNEIKNYKNIYEYDLFIGDINYINKGIGTKIVKVINDFIYKVFSADCIILRPFRKNIQAIKCYQKNNFKEVKTYIGTDTLGNKEEYLILINDKEKV